jgi:hypothetical protein
MKKGGVKEIYIEKDKSKAYYPEIKEQMEAIDKIDCFVFVEDIDTESCAYKYLNSLNLFRYQYNVSKTFTIFMFYRTT